MALLPGTCGFLFLKAVLSPCEETLLLVEFYFGLFPKVSSGERSFPWFYPWRWTSKGDQSFVLCMRFSSGFPLSPYFTGPFRLPFPLGVQIVSPIQYPIGFLSRRSFILQVRASGLRWGNGKFGLVYLFSDPFWEQPCLQIPIPLRMEVGPFDDVIR